MKAMILSAGFGTRLMPYTDNLPKALICHNNLPMINYQIEMLKKYGVHEIIVNAHHHYQKIVDYFAENDFGIHVNVIVENEILGTGGGILNASKYLRYEKFFIVINVDIKTNMDMSGIISYHKSFKPLATLAVQKRQTKRYLEFDDQMNLIGRENDKSNKKNLYAFNGIHIISNDIFKRNTEVKFEDILDIYFNKIKTGKDFVRGYNAGTSFFKDLGKIENLII